MRDGKSKVDQLVEYIHKFWWKPLLWGVIISVVGIFIASLMVSNTDYKESLNIANQWISVILGIVATVTSIISLILSFYNVHKSDEINRETTKLLNDIVLEQKEMNTKFSSSSRAQPAAESQKTMQSDKLTYPTIKGE